MQRIFSHLRLFSFFFFRYNPLLAFLVWADEIRGEIRYRLSTTGFEPGKDTFSSGGFSYMPSNYVLLERTLDWINQQPHNRSFLDMGCGKGRAMVVAAGKGFTNITGVEMVESYCTDLVNQLATWKDPTVRFDVHCCDAWDYVIPDQVQTLLFYNPFNETVMEKVVSHIRDSCKRAPRPVYVIYLNPLFPHLFLQSGFRQVYQTTRFRHLKACIYLLDPAGHTS